MSLRHAILGLLSQGPVHGYDLRSGFQRDLAPDDRLNAGQVYTTLDRLRRNGWVAQQVVAQSERPDKKIYTLTDAGRVELEAWLASPTPVNLDLRNETFLKLMTARRVDPDRPVAVIAVERRAAMARLHEMQRARVAGERDGVALQTRMMLELALLRLESFVKWLDRCEELLNGEQTP